jgi:GT2 family glycosyltransferase
LGAFDRTLSVVGLSPLFEAANLFVRRDLFERLGGFESWLGPREGKELGEDVWFGWRARRTGARIAAAPDALVHHAVIPRGSIAFAAERWRLRFFPALARRVPELRSELFFARLFLSERSARFDAALLGLLAATAVRRVRYAAAALPYVLTLSHDLREPGGPRRAAGRAAADAVGCAALALGSVRYRSPLL